MNQPATVTNASARLTMDSVNRLIEMEINAATAKLRGENESLRQTIRQLENTLLAGRNRHHNRLIRDGQMMVVIAIGCGVFGLLAGYLLSKVIA